MFASESLVIGKWLCAFEISNIITEIETITSGSYKDVTQLFKLNKGQKDEYYDYSRIVRNRNVPEPTRRLLVIFDYYSVPSDDTGDAFTVLSYDEERFEKDILEKIKSEKPEILDEIQLSGKLEENNEKLLTEIINQYKKDNK